MFEKNMRMAYLLDIYGDVLDEHAKSVMRAYYEDDLSLAEIAAGEDISRQGVRHIIKKSEEELEFLDSRLHLAAHYMKLEVLSEKLSSIADLSSLPSSAKDELRYVATELVKREQEDK